MKTEIQHSVIDEGIKNKLPDHYEPKKTDYEVLVHHENFELIVPFRIYGQDIEFRKSEVACYEKINDKLEEIEIKINGESDLIQIFEDFIAEWHDNNYTSEKETEDINLTNEHNFKNYR